MEIANALNGLRGCSSREPVVGALLQALVPHLQRSGTFKPIDASMALGGLAELPFLHNSLSTAGSWQPPAIYVYAPAMSGIALPIVMSARRACRSRGGAAAWSMALGPLVRLPWESRRCP
jgi:hypothetical protein